MSIPRQQFFEAFVKLNDQKYLDDVINHFEKSGLAVVRAKVGIFISGEAEKFEAAIGLDPNVVGDKTNLPIPNDMRHAVQSISILPVPDYY